MCVLYTDVTFKPTRFKQEKFHYPYREFFFFAPTGFSLYPHRKRTGNSKGSIRKWAFLFTERPLSEPSNHRLILFQTVQSNSSNPSESLLAPPSPSLADINCTSARGDTVAANATTSRASELRHNSINICHFFFCLFFFFKRNIQNILHLNRWISWVISGSKITPK